MPRLFLPCHLYTFEGIQYHNEYPWLKNLWVIWCALKLVLSKVRDNLDELRNSLKNTFKGG